MRKYHFLDRFKLIEEFLVKVIVKVTEGPEKGRVFEFNEYDTFLFGRSKNATCSLPNDNYISRHHFLLEINPPEVWLRDLSSLNKTYVNGVPYGGREEGVEAMRNDNFSMFIEKNMLDRKKYETEIKDGDSIKVGETSMSVSILKDESMATEEILTAEIKILEEHKTILKSPEKEKAAQALIIKILGEIEKKGKPNYVPEFPGYQILKRLGGGGMGDVYLAENLNSARKVAIKVIKPEKEVTKKDVARFLREMDISKSIKHKNLVQYIDGNYTSGIYYMIMEYIDGTDMQMLLEKEGRMSPINAAILIMQTLEGLAYMHKNNIIHRDLKPSNILLRKNAKGYTPAITDFGLAKNIKHSTQITKTGEAAGTLPYMAPEQIIDFKHVGESADIYAIGGTLYTICTGFLPHDYPKNLDPVMVQIQEPIIPVEKRVRDFPLELAAVINKSLEIKPINRFKNAEEFRKKLEESMA